MGIPFCEKLHSVYEGKVKRPATAEDELMIKQSTDIQLSECRECLIETGMDPDQPDIGPVREPTEKGKKMLEECHGKD